MTPLDRTCDAFLDDRLSLAERSRFEMRLVREPGLAAAVDLHRDVEASVRRSFQTPDLSGLLAKVEAAAARVREEGVEGAVRWVAAVGTLLFLCLTMCASSLLMPVAAKNSEGPSVRGWGSSIVEAVGLSLATASAVVASGAKLRRGRRSLRQQHRLQLAEGIELPLPAGVRVVTAERGSVLGMRGDARTVVLEDGRERAALVVMRADADPRPDLAVEATGLRFFRRELGGFVIYERTAAERAGWTPLCERTPARARAATAPA